MVVSRADLTAERSAALWAHTKVDAKAAYWVVRKASSTVSSLVAR